jgi:hypothetical protein
MVNLVIYIVLLFVEGFILVRGILILVLPEDIMPPWTGLVMIAVTIPLLVWNIVRIIKHNRQVQVDAQERLEQMEILAEWDSYGVRAKLTLHELFTGEHQHCFNAWYEKLDQIVWPIGGAFVTFKIRSSLMGSVREVHLEVPPEKAELIKAAVLKVRDHYQV